jgi:hypothetical protein
MSAPLSRQDPSCRWRKDNTKNEISVINISLPLMSILPDGNGGFSKEVFS